MDLMAIIDASAVKVYNGAILVVERKDHRVVEEFMALGVENPDLL